MRGYAILGLIGILITAMYFLLEPSSTSMLVFSNVTVVLLALVALTMALRNVRHYGISGKLPSAFLYFSVASLLWFLGEFTWCAYALLLGNVFPYPSIADVFWLAGYPFMLAGIIAYLLIFRLAIDKVKLGIGILVSALFSLAILLIFVIPITEISLDPLVLIIDLAYPFLDVITIFALVTAIITFIGGKIERVWYLLTLSVIMTAIADILFSYTTAIGAYYDGHPLELLYDYDYLLFSLAMYEHRRIL
ncbi:MAG: hypothetical protein QW265_04275 [Candidatus Bathyarchaeia archaeon]